MNRILSKNYRCLLNLNPSYATTTCSYQTQYQLKKFRFKRQNDHLTLIQNTNVTINDKTTCLENLKLTSTFLINDLKNLKWLKDLDDSYRQLKNLNSSYDLNSILARHLKSTRLNSLVEYIDSNFDTFTTKEKSLIFKVFALVNQQQKSDPKNLRLTSVLNRLEIDYYNNIDQCDLVDFCNYLDGFYLYRDSNLHFFTKSVDKIFRKALTEIDQNGTQEPSPVDALNKLWFENLKQDNKLILSLYTLNRLTLLNNDGKSIYFHNLITKHYDRLNNENVDVLATVMSHYNYNLPHMRLSVNQRDTYTQLFNSNLLNIVENIDKIKSKKIKVSVVDWLSRINTTDSMFQKYKISLINYFLADLKSVSTVPEFTASSKCMSLLINSFNRNSRNLKTSFYKTYEPLYNKLADKFVKQTSDSSKEFESLINFKAQSKTFNKMNRKFVSKTSREDIINKFNSLYDYFDIFSMSELVEANRTGELKWLGTETVQRFQSNYSYDLNSMDKEMRRLYLLEAAKMSRDTHGIQLSKKVLDSILKEYVITSKDKSFQKNQTNKDLSIAISLILNNHEYSVYKFNMLEPYIDNLIESDLQYVAPVMEALMNEFYYDTFPGKTTSILNRIRSKIADTILNYSDGDSVNLNEINQVLSNLFKSKNKIKFETNKNFDMSILKSNLEKCLSEFDSLCCLSGDQSRMNKNEIKNLSEQVKLFETRIYKYTNTLKQVSNLILLSNDYNPKLFADLTSCVLKLLGIFYDNLFTKVILDQKTKRNYFNKSLICDLLTVYGLYNYYDLNYMCRVMDGPSRVEFTQGIKELKMYNDNLYNLIRTNDKMDLLQLIDYNFSLFNLNVECDQAVKDMFENVRSFDSLVQNFSYLNQSRVELISKIVYFMNQALCIKNKNSNFEWLFKDSKPLLPVDSAFRDVHSTLNSILESNLVLTNPVYEYSFTANFEIAIDENNNFVDPRTSSFKYRIPILIVNNSYYYNECDEFKKPIATYVENFKKLYPLVTVNSSKLEEMKSMKDKLEYIRERIVNGLEEYADK